ncbi:PPE family protein [Mycobacterium servetii]|uniref:PPE family protein n=1 Tax=Mycobacterium servetii TaxID=3237418 RepID=A0ABV4BYK9_9MYCO
MVVDYSLLPPEINSGRMYAGPGSGSLVTAAAAWDALATELHSTAAQYRSVISGLTVAQWAGPSATAMATAAQSYVTWLHNTAGLAEQTAGQAKAAASAHAAALAAHVPPPVIASNRALLAALVANNYFGQYSAAIGETERQYAQMWAQDATAMHSYARSSSAASGLTPFSQPAQNTNPAGQAAQSASVAQVTGSSTGSSLPSWLTQLLGNGDLINADGLLGQMTGYGGQAFGNGTASWADMANALSNANNGIGLLTWTAENPGGLAETLNPAFVGPAALNFGGGAARAAATAGAAASAGQALKIGALSVPTGWATPAAAITPVSFTLPVSSATGIPVAAGGFPGGAFGETMLGTLAGRGLGGATARAATRRDSIVSRSPAGG